MNKFTRALSIPLITAMVSAAPAKVSAANISWDGDSGANYTWAEGLNWTGNTPPANDLTTDIAVFGAGALIGDRSPVLSATRSALGISFTAGGYNLTATGGSVLNLGLSGITGSSGSNTINHAVNLPSVAILNAPASSNIVVLSGGSNLTFSASSSFNMFINPASTGIVYNQLNIGAGSTLTINGAMTLTNSSAFSNDIRIQKTGDGTWAINSTNALSPITPITTTGRLALQAGTIEMGASGALGSAIIASNASANANKAILGTVGGITINNQIQFLNGGTTGSTASTHTLGGSNTSGTVTYDSGSSTRTVQLSNAFVNGTDEQKLTQFTAASGGTVEFVNNIVNNGAGNRLGGVLKVGDGTVVFDGANTYGLGVSGVSSTIVRAGTLLINNTTGSGTGADNVTVEAATFGGSGSSSGLTTTSGLASVISPGGGADNSLSLSSLNAASGATFKFDLGTTTDSLAITGLLTGSTVAGNLLFDLTKVGTLGLGSYTLVTFGSSTGLDFGDLAYVSLSGIVGTFTLNSNNITFNVTSVPEPSTVALAGMGLVVALNGYRRRWVA